MLRSFALLLCLALSACATQLGVRDAGERRLAMFSQVVFAPDYDSRRSDFVAKWTSPLRIAFSGDETTALTSTVKTQAKALGDLTGLDIALAGQDKPSNVTIIFATAEKMDVLASIQVRNWESVKSAWLASGCHSYFNKDAGHRITSGTILIRTGDDVTSARRCLAREMTRSLGFTNDSDLIQPSIFNPNSQLLQPTALDLKIVRSLYAPEVTPGMGRREVLAAAQKYLQK